MTDRAIYITEKDQERLAAIQPMIDTQDRGDLADLVDELNRAIVVAAEEIPSDVITMNSRVRLLDLDTRIAVEYTLVYPGESDLAKGKISVLAPVGAAMIGYREGDEIEWNVPGGRRRFKVEAVLYQPEAAGDTHL